jgi:hypothetical protein
MTDAPDKIWAGSREPEWFFDDPSDHRDGGYAEYTRTDISQAEYKKGFDDGCAHIMEDYKAGKRLDLRASQARIAPLEAALLLMVNHEVNYMDNNNLGDPEEQHRIKQARAALKAKP